MLVLFGLLSLFYAQTEALTWCAEWNPPPGSHKKPEKSRGTVKKFQVYQLSLSWASTFCETESGSEKQQCSGLSGTYGATHLTVHGLWPAYQDKTNSGNWPQWCKCGNQDCPDIIPDYSPELTKDLEQYAPGYIKDDFFLSHHEYCKHGTCAGFSSPIKYIQAAIDTIKKLPNHGTPPIILEKYGESISYEQLSQSFPAPPVFSCDDSCQLSEVILCFESPNPPAVGPLTECPDWSRDSCRGCDGIILNRYLNEPNPIPNNDPSPSNNDPSPSNNDPSPSNNDPSPSNNGPSPSNDDPSPNTEPSDTPPAPPTDSTTCPIVSGSRHGSVGGNHNFYQLSLSWTPQYCTQNSNTQLCRSLNWGKNHFTVQGLIPAYEASKGSFSNQYLQFCPCNLDECNLDTESFSTDTENKFFQYAPRYVTDGRCWAQRQWKTYGTCSGLSPTDYLDQSVNALLSIRVDEEGTPTSIFNAIGSTITTKALASAFPEKTGLICDQCTLSGAFPCFRITNTGDFQHVDCPSWVFNAKETNSCFLNGCSKINIPRFTPVHEDL